MQPLDLSQRPPRSPHEELGGLVFLPRTIDKLRAMLPGGNPGGYFINGPIKGMSGYLLERLGISEAQLSEVIAQAPDEAAVVEWIRAHSDPSQYENISGTIRAIKPKHAEDPAIFTEMYAETLRLHPGLERIIDIVEADDRRIFPATL